MYRNSSHLTLHFQFLEGVTEAQCGQVISFPKTIKQAIRAEIRSQVFTI